MDTRQLGTNGPDVSVICLGAWPLGGGMGVIPDKQAIATIHASIDAGANFIDTAEGYRTSEGVLGKALKGRRDQVFLATKLSGDQSVEHMAEAIENSLRLLGTDCIDLYQLHRPQFEIPIEDTMANLEKLRDEGKIRYIGVSNFSGDHHRQTAKHGTIHSSQPRYNMLTRQVEDDVLPACEELGTGVIPHSVLAKAMLSGKYRPGHVFPSDDERVSKPEFHESVFIPAMKIVEKLLAWAGDHGREGPQLAIAWCLANPVVTSCIVGAKTPEQAVYNAEAAEWKLSENDMAELAEILGDFRLPYSVAG
ncbi:aldo/keto reductase [Candidatus Lucifugimonas marina]|uniref:Aldo/keto reductase n=1 Tax=Candidatus Lucifugimonas marina TaxID=3038979 RepID=A0AAJ6CVG1_9CHLR|nr:aldo/keto reductase [SAR202 cluster bacterium JH639]WFG36006.1 aldo/keto reductase [SAR202 cluster bacterium JH545]WFG39950.1 aldo/keto reductase [SAR202 cluster bacterium JH1073]